MVSALNLYVNEEAKVHAATGDRAMTEDEKKANAKADKLAHDAQKKVDGWQVRKFCVCALCWIERARSLATSTRMRLS